MRWEPGRRVLQQDLWTDRLLTSRPVTIVEDCPDLLALYTHPGAPFQSATITRRYDIPVAERVEMMIRREWDLAERVSGEYHVLTLTPPNSFHSVWLFWSTDWQLKFWYVNLQTPIKRTRRGIVVLDYALDIVVRPDMTWSWKDEDELQELHRRGVLTDREVEAARTEGERMIEVIENNGPPFCDGWERWRARPEWPAPFIPADWDALSPDDVRGMRL